MEVQNTESATDGLLKARLRRAEAELEQMSVAVEDLLADSVSMSTEIMLLQSEADHHCQRYRAAEALAQRLIREHGLPTPPAGGSDSGDTEAEIVGSSLQALSNRLNYADAHLARITAVLEQRVEQRSAELAAAREQQRESELNQALRHSRSCHWHWNLQSDKFEIDSACIVELLGLPAPTTRRQWLDRVHPDDRDALKQAVQQCLDGSVTAIDIQYRVRPTGLRVSWLATRGVRVEAADGSPCLSGLTTDITDLKLAEAVLAQANANLNRQFAEQDKEFQQARAQLQQKQRVEALGMIAGGVAHDFNNLLSVIGNNAYLLTRVSIEEQRSTFLRQIISATDRGSHLTGRLLAFGKPGDTRIERVDLARDFEDLRSLLSSALRGNLRLQHDIDPRLWPIQVDRTELHLALLNLSVNARDAMPQGGAITLTARNLEFGPADIEGLPIASGDYVQISIADRGCGMAPDVVKRIFEPFYTTKAEGKGTGLGLPQVIGFARNQGGTVLVQSQLGAGSTFSVLLPRAVETSVAMVTPATEYST